MHHVVFVDFENLQQVDLGLIAGKPVEVCMLIGNRQKNLPVGLVKKLVEHAPQVRLIEVAGSGKNALDFVLAYHLGLAVAAQRDLEYHIVSRDKGFDVLVAQLRKDAISISRHDSFAAAVPSGTARKAKGRAAASVAPAAPTTATASQPAVATASSAPKAARTPVPTERDIAARVVELLSPMKTGRPRTRARLLMFIKANRPLGVDLEAAGMSAQGVLDALLEAAAIEISGNNVVSYKF